MRRWTSRQLREPNTRSQPLSTRRASRLVRSAGRLPNVITIDDADDPRLDPYRSLRARESAEVLWAEGPTVVERLLGSAADGAVAAAHACSACTPRRSMLRSRTTPCSWPISER